MKNSVQTSGALLLTLAILPIFALSACASTVAPAGDTSAEGKTTDVASDAVKSNDTAGTGLVDIAADETKTPEVTDDVKTLLENQDQLNVLVAKGDVAGCKDLQMEQFQVSCETNILVNKAVSNTDVAVCDTASSDDIKTRCAEMVASKKF